MTKCVRNFALLMTIAMVVSLPAVAQQAALTGTVTDPTGAVIPGAEVTLTHKGTGVTRTTTTRANGGYLIQQLDPGQYRLEITTQGFKTMVQDPINLPVGITSTLNASLEIGAVTEQVLVEEGISSLNTADASLGDTITGTQIQNLPLEGLDPAGLLSLQPGVTFVPTAPDLVGGYSGASDFDGRGGSVNGSRSDQTNITLDGVDVNDPQNGYAFTSALRATQASLQEFRVSTSNYNADQGRSSAAQVQLVTKSGTNDPHGSVYWTHRNEAWAANNFFNNQVDVEKGKLRRHIYGMALGGPIVKDRLFIFGNYERLEHSEEATGFRDVPSDSFRDGVMIYQCEGGVAACPGNSATGVSGASYSSAAGFYAMSPAEMTAVDPLGIGPNAAILSYLQTFPAPNDSGQFDAVNIVGFRFNSPVENSFNTYIARLDFNIDRAGNHTFYARGTLHDDAIVATPPYYPGNPANQLQLGNSRGIALGYKAVVSPTIVNTLRYGFTRIGEKASGVRNSEFVNLRFIDDLTGFDAPGGGSNTKERRLPQYHLRNDTSVTRGTHTLSFGGEARFTRNRQQSNAASFHSFSTNPSWLPNVGRGIMPGQPECLTAGCAAVPAVASAFSSAYRDSAVNMLGLLTQASANYNFLADGSTQPAGEFVSRKFAVDEYEWYVQDQWRVTSTLTLTAGLRYFLTSPPWEANGNQVAPTVNLGEWFELRRQLMLTGQPTNLAPQITFDLAGPENNGPDYYEWDYDNWSPRLAVAWAPRSLGWFSGNGKLVIRGGYSLVFDRVGNGLVTSFDAGGAFGMSTNIDSTFGNCDEGTGLGPLGPCSRFSGPFDASGISAQLLPPSPGGGFPATAPGADPITGILEPGAFAITQALDGSIETPYAHVINVAIARELPGGFTVEGAYVGRRGRKLLMIRDAAMPADLVDPASGVTYFQAATQMVAFADQGVDINSVAPNPFWENLFPSFGPGGVNGGFLPCEVVPGSTSAGGFSATQVAYDWTNCLHPDTTAVPWAIDNFGFPGYMNCSTGTDLDGDGLLDCPFALFDDQYATLQVWSSIARSEYHAFQLSVRRRLSQGFQFSLNYTLAHSLDHASTPERSNIFFGFFAGGYSGSTINAWELDQEYADSDFDMRHQLNTNWYVEMPFGHGKALGSGIPGWANQFIGGWRVSGIVRVNSGLPASVVNDRVWPTNWDLQGNATCGPAGGNQLGVATAPCPATGNVKNAAGDRGPNLFADPDTAFGRFRFTLPGDRGPRNNLLADNYFNFDLSIAKVFNMPWEGHSFKFRWDVFNVTNSVYFDAVSLDADIGSQGTFGNYTALMGSPRRMQVTLRYEF